VAEQLNATLVAGSALVFFEDETKMLEFAKSEYAVTLENCDYNIQSVTTALTTNDIYHYVMQATRAGQVTRSLAFTAAGSTLSALTRALRRQAA